MNKFISKILIIVSSTLAAFGLYYTQSQTSTPPPQYPTVDSSSFSKALDYAQKHLPLTGELILKSDGFGYLKVDDGYIKTLFPMLGLQKEGFKPPPYFRTKEAPGAHISVFYENEHIVPKEVGQTFHFKSKKIAIVKASRGASYAVLEVESPELEQLREKYGLSPKLSGHDFHISLAKKITPKHSHENDHFRHPDQRPHSGKQHHRPR